ncbi:MAG: chemotaxis protein CheB [Verrucomicrobia bacterium]|nr:chemotaxis protein CheB [Verrucomicrobiota bacterium]
MDKNLPSPSVDQEGRDVVVIGGSSGSIEAFRSLIATIPGDIPAALFVVIHTSATGPYLLPSLLQKDTELEFATVEDKAPVSYGKIYLARPNLNLLLEDNHIRVVFGPKENRMRPAIDALFRSAAWARRNRVTGILLSGGLDDGVAGLWDIRCCGGATMVQDPNSAAFPELIHNALNAMPIDYVAPPEKMSEIIQKLARTRADETGQIPDEQDRIELENQIEIDSDDHSAKLEQIGRISAYTCPGCGGPLWQLPNGSVDRYRCRVGHAYSVNSLFQACWEASERNLYTALQLLEENARVGNQIIRKAEKIHQLASKELVDQVRRLEREADILRNLLYDRTQGKESS